MMQLKVAKAVSKIILIRKPFKKQKEPIDVQHKKLVTGSFCFIGHALQVMKGRFVQEAKQIL
jgi:hypothetical protein